ncbi:hypothetical protein FOXG_14137 [Fusarium oxysporum f. sp. lycopersici 4287]|uniref:BZIP domain-containing protein n=1 Tax=Fusarium oxysporum f. sp. lycopersici (strain 4287 / CBS 123668 / FGSC 9935 / NRRL 34936) TaxID=426428 RepID=A0A0J9VXN8_FUSO4|nr:hypothetical protein FOXG_14137 [Fusarium oxysporum f. sp. lycopersici 4287]EWZ77733.1 hypothetical protein FOWG_17883 [Fusarium oxysporum f. sp. lycopersici MN25]KAJ9413799.1 hypothetical protein QL093DRAFT_2107645 [Fusarium oxysporum]KNB15714.1 hypothetical protein FOXG_14137 [Fusarium oxysporum f. sp. lycopersici 4287]
MSTPSTPPSRPGSAATDSTGASRNSPRTPSTPAWPSKDLSLSKPATSQDNKLPSGDRLGEGQCDSPRDEVCTGGLVSMMHTGPASQHASRRSPRSPLGDNQVSPSSIRRRQLSDRDVRQDVSNVPYANGEKRLQRVPQKTLGVHNILNPMEPRLLALGGNGHLPPTARPSESATPGQTVGSVSGSFAGPQAFSPAQPALPGTALGPMTPLGGPSSGRNSPTAFPFPTVNSARQKASPTQDPRAIRVNHVLSCESDGRQSLHGSSSAKRPFEDITPEDTRTQYPHLHPPPGAQAPLPTFPPNPAPGCPHPPLVHPQTSYSPNMQAGRPFPSPGPPSESASPWSETLRRHGMGGSLFGVEGQQALLALPGNQEPIPVHVDFSQASKKADEKRHRNAEASTRHRRKKKIMQEEKAKQLQELRDERRLMEIRIEELIQQGDFYREDRNRLRDIVAQTASISSLAAGPPSPTISISNSYAETGSLASGPSGSMSYGDILSNERPAQRRRTDDRPEYSVPPYGSPASGHPSASPSGLPPMPMAGYGGPSRPSCAASSASGERLPPLRVMEGLPPTGLPPGQAFKSRIREPVSGFPFSLEFQRLDGQQGTLIVGLDVMEFV